MDETEKQQSERKEGSHAYLDSSREKEVKSMENVEVYGGTLRKVEGDKLTFEIGKVVGEPMLEILDLKEIEIQVMNDFWEDMVGLKVGIIKGKNGKPIIQLCKVSENIYKANVE